MYWLSSVSIFTYSHISYNSIVLEMKMLAFKVRVEPAPGIAFFQGLTLETYIIPLLYDLTKETAGQTPYRLMP